METPALTRRDRERLARRRAILDAALSTFAAKGYEGATLNEVAERAEFGKGTLYNYFPGGKEEILFALFDEVYDGVVDLTNDYFAGEEEGERATRDVFRDFFAAFEDSDASRLAGLLNEDCVGVDEIAESAVRSYLSRGLEGASYDVTGATIRDLTEGSAEAIPEGIVRFEGGESPLADGNSEYARFVKVEGEWKLADCNILF